MPLLQHATRAVRIEVAKLLVGESHREPQRKLGMLRQ